MDTLTLAAVCILCATHPDQQPVSVSRWQPWIAEASARFGVPQAWVARVIEAESAGRPTRNGEPITSSADAMGLMQVMPRTFADMQRQYGLGTDPYDPRTNILAGTAYLKAMYQRYGYPNLFAAYNAGPARFDAYLLHQRALPNATIVYVDRIIPGSSVTFEATDRSHDNLRPTSSDPPKSALFFAVGRGHETASPVSIEPEAGGSLFVRLSPPEP